MENIDKLEVIIDFLDSDVGMEELINDIVEENLEDFDESLCDIVEDNFEDLDESLLCDKDGNSIYKDIITKFLKTYDDIKTLSDEEIQLLLNMVIKCILHKINTKRNAQLKANENSNYIEFKEYYGGRESAFWHLLDKYLGDFGYNKSIKEFYYENQDTKKHTH